MTIMMADGKARHFAERIGHFLRAFGLQPVVTVRAIRGIPRFFRNAIRYRRLQKSKSFRLTIGDLTPVLNEFDGQAGTARGHYFHQDLWAARKIYAKKPPHHYDMGSRIDGFVAHLLTFMEVQVIDVLPLKSTVTGLHFTQMDGTQFCGWPKRDVQSLSSLHAAEHFGLGRYSDPIDPLAHEKVMSCLKNALSPGGALYFSVPIGRERMMYNAHRIFSVETILQNFAGLTLRSFSYVDDAGEFHENKLPTEPPSGLRYGCGLFEFSKD